MKYIHKNTHGPRLLTKFIALNFIWIYNYDYINHEVNSCNFEYVFFRLFEEDHSNYELKNAEERQFVNEL